MTSISLCKLLHFYDMKEYIFLNPCLDYQIHDSLWNELEEYLFS